ncbi:MAG: amino acid permease, partial [Elusimicrobia bacterium]|nr:amino acid permease [Elusimicrobiota bacterium]
PSSRVLGFFDSYCIGVNAIVGTSIFLFPGLLMGLLGPVSPIAFLLTGFLLLPVALCYAAAASRFDRAGGPYLYVRSAFGDTAGFGVGWMCWVTELSSWAAVASGLAAYLGYFGGGWTTPAMTKVLGVTVVAVMGTINYRGVRLGAWTSNTFTVAKLIPLAAFILLGAFHLQSANFSPLLPMGWSGLGKACFLAFFAFSGFEVVPVPAGEARAPGTDVPKALVASLLTAAVLYTLVQAVAVGTHPGLAASSRPLADAASLFLGPVGAAFMVLGAAISNIGFNAGCALGGPRYLVALCEDRHLPAWFAARHPRFDTPHRSVALTAGLTAAAVILLDFNKLVDFAVVVICVQYLGTCCAVPFLVKADGARRAGALRRWILAGAGIAASLCVGTQAGWKEFLCAAVILGLGFGLRAAFSRA